jgi:hypothetical protein
MGLDLLDPALVGVVGTPTCVEATYANLPTETLTQRTCGRGREGMGFRPDASHILYEKLIKSIKLQLNNDGASPIDTISVRVRDSSNAIVNTFGTMSATTLTASFAEYTFDTTEIQLSAGDFITLEYDFGIPPVQVRVFQTGTDNYIANATSLVCTTTGMATWNGWYDFDYFWLWLEAVYCE